MSLQDPVSDMLTRIRNAQMANLPDLRVSSSKVKCAIVDLLKEEGYLDGYEILGDVKTQMLIKLRYHKNKPVISKLKTISRPGLRTYLPCSRLPKVLGGLGVAVVSTSKGLMTDRRARSLGLGGEVLLTVS